MRKEGMQMRLIIVWIALLIVAWLFGYGCYKGDE